MASLLKQDVKVWKDTKMWAFVKAAAVLLVGTFFEKYVGVAQAIVDSVSK